MIPVNYTNTTFADYLKDEVLMDTAVELGWLDVDYTPDWGVREVDELADPIYDAIPYVYTQVTATVNVPSFVNRMYGDGYVTLTATGSGTVTRGIAPSLYAIPTGTKVTFTATTGIADGSNVYTTAAPVNVGDTSITFTATNSSTTGWYGWFYHDTEAARVTNPIYQGIIDSTMIMLGEDDIESIADVKKLRLYGRREAWKFAMQTLAGDYSYSTHLGSSTRYDVYLHCKDVWIFEDNRIRGMYGEAGAAALKQSQYLVTTQRSKIKVRW